MGVDHKRITVAVTNSLCVVICGTECYCVCYDRVVAGTFDKKVFQLDVREDCPRIVYYRCHSKPVLAVKITPRHILRQRRAA